MTTIQSVESANGGFALSETDIALRRYEMVFQYLATEHTMTWAKNQFFLGANAGLFALVLTRFPQNNTNWVSSLVLLAFAVMGLLFSILWLWTLKKAAICVEWWTRICEPLEPTAFGNIRVLRGAPKKGTRRITGILAVAFIAIWGALSVLTIAYLPR